MVTKKLLISNLLIKNEINLLLIWVEYSTYLKSFVSDGQDTAQETSNSQQYG